MGLPSLGDLRYLYFGGGSDAEYAALAAFAAQGINAVDLLALPSSVGPSIDPTITARTNATGDLDFCTALFPANSLRVGDVVMMQCWANYLCNNATMTTQFRFKANSTAMVASTATQVTSSASARALQMTGLFKVTAAAVEAGFFSILHTAGGASAGSMSTLGGAAYPSAIGYGAAAIAITSAITLAMSIEYQSAASTVSITPIAAFASVVQRIAA